MNQPQGRRKRVPVAEARQTRRRVAIKGTVCLPLSYTRCRNDPVDVLTSPGQSGVLRNLRAAQRCAFSSSPVEKPRERNARRSFDPFRDDVRTRCVRGVCSEEASGGGGNGWAASLGWLL